MGASHLENSGAPRGQKSSFQNNQLVFESEDGFKQAVQDGFFFVKIPDSLDLTPGLKLGSSFHKDDTSTGYDGYKDKTGIYFDRDGFQTEHILLDQKDRARHFPRELQTLCDEMNALGIIILKYALEYLKLPSDQWSTATGNAVNNEGTHWTAFSHYRTSLRRPGCATHKDTGFVTLLYIDQEGLEIHNHGKWEAISPLDGYFVVNFGGSLEILTRNTKQPIQAALHRVREIHPSESPNGRISFAAFVNPPAQGDLYTYDQDGELRPYKPVRQYLEEFNKQVWNDDYMEFGLTR